MNPEWTSAAAVGFAFCLLGLISALEKKTHGDSEELRAQIKDLRGKVELLMIGKGFGR